eukprot:TRINITY_DN13395_c0_g1_i4.p1 TRINITY_DN13395_c0_g1~~TRINITY_DN13395_c0_g1_i4.p1  ORF type:complete len:141 (-),score=12.50 TRINITY_DN13395_c0_g1_i4:4-426(-)
METIIRNSPSSNTWVRFEDSDEVRDTTSAPGSSAFRNARKEHKDSLSTESIQRVFQDQQEIHFLIPQSDARKSEFEDVSSVSFKRNSFPNRSRYAALTSLGLVRTSTLTWGGAHTCSGRGIRTVKLCSVHVELEIYLPKD